MYCGIDIGARSIGVVIFDGAQVVESLVSDTGVTPAENALKTYRSALEIAVLEEEEISAVISTGYGRNYFKKADRSVSEIICHAKGVSFLFPSARTVIDIGGQDSKFIELDSQGKPVDFVMNDRCAAGTGRFIEMIGSILGVPLDCMNSTVSSEDGRLEISSMCAVFAESEIVGLLQSGAGIGAVLNGVFSAVARRTTSMAGRDRIIPDLVFTGGVAKNDGVVAALRAETGLDLLIPYDPQITGALGAAIIGSKR